MNSSVLPLQQCCELPTPASTQALGERLARCIPWQVGQGVGLHLQGELGAGKTSLAQALLRALGVQGAIPSPSYTLIEPYNTDFGRVLHVDLYRLRSAQELDDLGMRDEWPECALRLVEWPEHGAGALPPADLSIEMQMHGDGRRALLTASSGPGETWLLACAGKQFTSGSKSQLVFS